MNWMQGMQNITKKRKDLDEVFFERANKYANAKARRKTRELHLEMVGDNVTYVRVY